MNHKMIRYTLGLILLFEAAFFILPAIVAVCFFEWRSLASFGITAAACLLVGLIMSYKKPSSTKLYAKEGFIIVSLSWIAISVFGALPFVLSGSISSYIDALFEIVSGFTTTGVTIISDVEALPRSILTWRSFSHWIGGMGVLVFVMAILPLSGAQNMHIMRAESPGPDVSKLVPRVRKSAIILYVIYFAMTVVMFIFLLFDMSFFDAMNIAFSTAGTGGFCVKNDSINGYSTYIKIICTVFMLIFSVNFNAYYLMLRKKWRDAFNAELKTFIIIVICAISLITLNLALTNTESGKSIGQIILDSAFTAASAISSTGFFTANYRIWPILSHVVIALAIFVGACAGSTGGGFKVSRLIILSKGMLREMSRQIHPRQVKKITLDKKPLDHEVVRTVNAYLVTYVIIFAASMLLVSLDNYTSTIGSAFTTNFSAVLTTLSNCGLGFDMIGPGTSFAFFSPFTKLVLVFDMLAGRLELFPLLLLFSPASWKK